MELGVNLPTANTPNTSPEAVVRIAQAAERLGHGAVWTNERLLRPTADVPQPGGPPRPLPEVYEVAYDPLETLAFVAARTERIRLGTSVVDALFHPPVVLAKRYATLDRLSGGRVIAGLGQGWMAQESRVAGVAPKRRGPGWTSTWRRCARCGAPTRSATRDASTASPSRASTPSRRSRGGRRSCSAPSRRRASGGPPASPTASIRSPSPTSSSRPRSLPSAPPRGPPGATRRPSRSWCGSTTRSRPGPSPTGSARSSAARPGRSRPTWPDWPPCGSTRCLSAPGYAPSLDAEVGLLDALRQAVSAQVGLDGPRGRGGPAAAWPFERCRLPIPPPRRRVLVAPASPSSRTAVRGVHPVGRAAGGSGG
jgi:hypothetical protein